jgi:AcrR family transcriptional regulator
MTDKKESILIAALELFSKEGFKATSTSKVAKAAGVSEGLIFRHFGNKDGLLKAILELGEEKAKTLFADIVLETDPKKVIRKTCEFGIHLSQDKSQMDFWKLQYKIKWEIEQYNEQKMEPLEMALSNAFEKLKYEHPHLEAQQLLLIIDGLATRTFLQDGFQYEEIINFLIRKYKV